MSEQPTRHHARVIWRADKQDLRAHEIHLADQLLEGSCAQALGGDPTKADPEEMFVAALSACHMLWFLDFARRERLRVLSYEDQPEGEMDDTRFIRVVLRPTVRFDGEIATETIERLHQRAHEACFIANSVDCPVIVEPASKAGTGSAPA
jgi:organic hydroperoxide reductase OsmC/OhrA